MQAGGNLIPSATEEGADSRWGALETTLPLLYVAEFDRAGTFRYVSGVVEQWTGHPPADFLADSALWYDCLHPEDVARVRNAEQLLFDTKEQLNLEYRMIAPDGRTRWVWERNTIVRDGRGVPMCTLGTVLDLSRYGVDPLVGVDADAHTALLIRRSFLTGLPTRQVLHEHLELALARADRDGDLVALLDIDLDRFRSVNDAIGHAGGDVVLAQVANRLRECCPAGELLLHSGADEFLLMLSGLEADAADAKVVAAAQTIADGLAAPFEVADQRVEVRASIGYALGPVDGGDPEELHRSAHSALAAAKAAGRGELCRYHAGAADTLRRTSVDHRLRRAIEGGHVKPHFQPIVDLATDEIRGVEALARWESDGELLLPASFVPVAEESSLIIDLDMHMIRQACEAARKLRDRGDRVRVHANISGRIVSWHGFVRVVLEAIDAAGIEPRDLSLELTESAAVSGPSGSIALLELRDAGVTIVMDDFGSAYSSVARLRTLPVTQVKIDRAMVLAATGELPPAQRLGPASATPEAGAAILAGVMGIAGRLGLRTIVEGVETREVRDLVQTLGADMAQGYFFGRPAPFDDLVETLRQAGR